MGAGGQATARRPEVGAPNAIGKQEMQAICRYAEERNINISLWWKGWDTPVSS